MEVTRCQISTGQAVQRTATKYKKIKEQINVIRERYRQGTIDIMVFLDGIGNNLKN